MDNKPFLSEDKALKTLCASVIIYILLFLFLKNNYIYISHAIRVIFIVLSFVLYIIINKVNSLKDEYIYTAIKDFLIMKSIIAFLGISMITESYSLSEKNNYINMSINIIIFLDILFNYILKEYYINKNTHKKMVYVVYIFSVGILLAYINLMCYSKIFMILKIICIIIQVILCLHIYNNIRITNKLNDNNFKVGIIYTIVVCTIEFINVISDKFHLINIILENVCLCNFLMFFLVVTTNQIKEPYERLINVLQSENYQLDELNLKIIMKNKYLEKLNVILNQKEELNYTFFRFMPNPIIILNSENNRITFVNNKFLKLAEIGTAREIINKKIEKLIEFTTYSEENDFNAILYIGSKRKYLKAKFIGKYESDDRKLIVIEDHTEKVQIREMRNEIERRKRNEQIRSQFLSSISHDLKTPINVIYSGLQLEQIYIEKGDIESLKKYNKINWKNCISLIELTNNLIDNSKISSHFLTANLKTNNLVNVIEEQVMSYVDYAKWNGIELIFDTNTEECIIDIDVEFMRRIILNLISNSVKYTPQNGKIFVIIDEKLHSVSIKVKDTGCGIKSELKDKIFNQYISSNKAIADAKSGTGLGLFVVKKLVELQNGIIYVDDDEKNGTTIVIELKKGETYV